MKLNIINSNFGSFKNDDGKEQEFANIQGFNPDDITERGGNSFNPGFSGLTMMKMSCTEVAAQQFEGPGEYDLSISIKNQGGKPVAFCQNMKKL